MIRHLAIDAGNAWIVTKERLSCQSSGLQYIAAPTPKHTRTAVDSGRKSRSLRRRWMAIQLLLKLTICILLLQAKKTACSWSRFSPVSGIPEIFRMQKRSSGPPRHLDRLRRQSNINQAGSGEERQTKATHETAARAAKYICYVRDQTVNGLFLLPRARARFGQIYPHPQGSFSQTNPPIQDPRASCMHF